MVVTPANVHELTPVAELRHSEEEVVYGDAGYQGIAKRPEMAGKTAEFRVAMRPGTRRALADTLDERVQDLIETAKAHIRSKVEHPLPVIKQQLAFGRPGCVAWPRTAAKSMCWQRCRICTRPDGNYSRQCDQGLGVSAHLDLASNQPKMARYVSPMSSKNDLRGNLRLKPLVPLAAAAQTPFVQRFLWAFACLIVSPRTIAVTRIWADSDASVESSGAFYSKQAPRTDPVALWH